MNPIRHLARRIRAALLRRRIRVAHRNGADELEIIDLQLRLQHLNERP